MGPMPGPGPWDAMLERLDDAAKLTGVDPDIHRLLRTPRRILEVAVPVRMDDGRVEVFTGWRVDHDTTPGPGEGGIRFPPDVDAAEGTALAARMTVKTAGVKPPLRGGQGGGPRPPPRRRRRGGPPPPRRSDVKGGVPTPPLGGGGGGPPRPPPPPAAGRARASPPPLHLRDLAAARAGQGRPRAGRQHRRTG